MQISATNLLIASQQARPAQPAKAAKEAFEPLPLRQAEAPAAAAQAESPAQRPGSQLDIRV